MVEIIIISVLVLLCIIGSIIEKKIWNKGFCQKCQTKWKYFDTDSIGGRGYKCETCGKAIWITYRTIDRREK